MKDRALESLRLHYDERAETYDESGIHRAVAAAVAQFVTLSGVEAVLDVATGTGLALRAIRDRLGEPAVSSHLRLVGVDLSRGMLAVARRELPGATLFEGNAATLPLPAASFDLITCVTALHVMPDWQAAVREWRRVLRRSGRAVTATFKQADRGRQRTQPLPYSVDHAPFSSAAALAASVSPFGFSVQRTETLVNGEDEVLLAELALASDDSDKP